jgi:hypothetical protein
MKNSGMLWKYNIPQKEIQETYRISKGAIEGELEYTVHADF